jgi:hypothetical protein
MFSLNTLISQLTFTGKTRNILAVLLNGLIRKRQNHKKHVRVLRSALSAGIDF